jgi:hypothetical protein
MTAAFYKNEAIKIAAANKSESSIRSQSSSLADAAAPAHDEAAGTPHASMSRIHFGATGIRSASAL